jgi:hypothetical protein
MQGTKKRIKKRGAYTKTRMRELDMAGFCRCVTFTGITVLGLVPIVRPVIDEAKDDDIRHECNIPKVAEVRPLGIAGTTATARGGLVSKMEL